MSRKAHEGIERSFEYHTEKTEEQLESGRAPHPKPKSKFKPKGIDPAYPNRNFVKMSYENKGENYYEHLYPMHSMGQSPSVRENRKPSHYGHSIGQRAGKLRLSGTAGAHRIGKRK